MRERERGVELISRGAADPMAASSVGGGREVFFVIFFQIERRIKSSVLPMLVFLGPG